MRQLNWRFLTAAGAIAVIGILVVAAMRSDGDSTIFASNDAAGTPGTQASAGVDPTVTPAPATPTTAPDVDVETPSAPTPAPETAATPPESEQATPESGAGEGATAAGDMRCILYLHGAGTVPDALSDAQWEDDLLYLAPHSGNPEWPHMWLYDGPDDNAYDPGDSTEPFDTLVSSLTDYLDQNDCGPVMMHGESNGGAMAARIYCSGEDFGGRLWMAFMDDPVPDATVVGCSPSPAVQRAIFTHSAELASKAATFVDDRCSQTDAVEYPWYCMDDIGFDEAEYESHIGQDSVLTREEHLGVNIDEYNFWMQVHVWWEDFDPDHYAEHLR